MVKKGILRKTTIWLLTMCLLMGSFMVWPASEGSVAYAASKVTKLSITPNKTQSIAIGETVTLKASRTPKSAKGTIVWTTNKKSVATVSQKGVVKGIKAGTSKITATVKGTKVTASCTVKVLKAARSLTLSPKTVSLKIGKKRTLTAKFSPSGSKSLLTWKSDKTSIAKVSKTGEVTAVKAGKAVITATVKGKNIKNTCTVTVEPDIYLAQSVTVGQREVGLKEGETSQIAATVAPTYTTNKAVTYTSSNNSVATVSKTGLITAVKKGTATVTVKTADGSNKTANVAVTVNPVIATGMSATVGKTSLVAGETIQINAQVTPAKTSIKTVKYTSSDPLAAEVSNTGLITARAQGTTTITVETVDGSNLKKSFELVIDYDRVNNPRPRTIATTDGEVDDLNSLIHLMLYTNEIDLVGIVQTSAQHHWQGSPDAPYEAGKVPYRWVGIQWKYDVLNGYEEVYSNLIQHADGYPTPNYLRSITKEGNLGYRGDMSGPTEGSTLIRNAILDNDERTLYIQAWGGFNTIAMALKQIEDEYRGTPEWSAIYEKVTTKAVLSVCGFQDSTYDEYTKLVWPDLTVVNAAANAAYGYGTKNQGSNEMKRTVSGPWMYQNIESGHGALLDHYVTWGDGTYLEGEMPGAQFGTNDDLLSPYRGWWGGPYERYDFLSEGDSPTYFYLFDTGLRSMEGWNYGGWSGRFYDNTVTGGSGYGSRNDYSVSTPTGITRDVAKAESALMKWVEYIQYDFAARADWCITPRYEDANHRPEITIQEGLDITAAPGEEVKLNAVVSDPDGDKVTVNWWHYYEAGKDIQGTVEEYNPLTLKTVVGSPRVSFKIPADAQKGDTFHLIATAQDNGEHTLTYNQRVIVTVGDPQQITKMTIKASNSITKGTVTEGANTVVSNIASDDRVLWVEFEPELPGMTVTWESSDTSVATVTAGGTTNYTTVTARGNGTTTITATANDINKTKATLVLNVKMVASRITLTVPSGMNASALPLGAPVTLASAVLTVPDIALTWSSSNETVATVDNNGVVTPLKAGKVIISAVAQDEGAVRGVIQLTFVPVIAPTGAVKEPDNAEEPEDTVEPDNDMVTDDNVTTIEVGQEIQLNVAMLQDIVTGDVLQLSAGGEADDANLIVSWNSSDSSVVTVTADGRVAGVAVGTVTITASSTTGPVGIITLRVVAP